MAIGGLLIAWVAVTVWWGDPFTSLYTRHEQRALAHQLDTLDRQWAGIRPMTPAAAPKAGAATATILRRRALAFRRLVRDGKAIGRISIPRIGLRMVVVEGTSESDLKKGPGHYNAASGKSTSLPGMGGVIAIAGHRTTYLHPFRHIDDLHAGDLITLSMPYGTFRYRVYYHRIVGSNDWRILQRRPFEKLVLSACHPLYSASHRWVVYARLISSGGLT